METWERKPREGVVGCSGRNNHGIVEGQGKGQLGAWCPRGRGVDGRELGGDGSWWGSGAVGGYGRALSCRVTSDLSSCKVCADSSLEKGA